MPGNEIMPPADNKAINLDVVFLQDCTDSMQPYIDALRDHIKEMTPRIEAEADLKGGNARYRVIGFRDHREQGCDWLVKQFDFVNNSDDLVTQFAGLEASGGGDGPEAQIEGLDAARRSAFRQGVKKLVILITDSPPHGIGEPGDTVPTGHSKYLTIEKVTGLYKERDIQINVLGCVPGITNYVKAEKFYKDLSLETGGLYTPIPEPQTNLEALKGAVVGCIAHATKSFRTADRFAEYIVDQSHWGQNALVNQIHSQLIREGNTNYSFSTIDRDQVDALVRKTLRHHADLLANFNNSQAVSTPPQANDNEPQTNISSPQTSPNDMQPSFNSPLASFNGLHASFSNPMATFNHLQANLQANFSNPMATFNDMQANLHNPQAAFNQLQANMQANFNNMQANFKHTQTSFNMFGQF